MKFFKPFLHIGLFTFTTTMCFAAPPSQFYESSEHAAAGSNITLHFPDHAEYTKNYFLTLPNGLKITYGELVVLGDFYGVIGHPISQEKSLAERKKYFQQAFSSFALRADTKNEVRAILDVVDEEEKAIQEGLAEGIAPDVTYKKIAEENNRQWNCITGGGCAANVWWMLPGRYLALASQDYDHFGAHALATYQAGHAVALEEAIAAHKTQDQNKLELAYALNAYACHFLSDRYASGHIRTPRVELAENTTPPVVGSLLVNYMHNEENAYGLHVHNQRGEHWLAFGDRYYFDAANKSNREHLQKVMQASADQIFMAYQTGVAPTDDAEQLIPEPDETNNTGQTDIAPLFYWDEKSQQLFRRENTANVNAKSWTTNWWGWTTLLQLKRERGLSTVEQAALVQQGFGATAMQYGLITDKEVLQLQKQM